MRLRGTPTRLPLGRAPACSDVVGDGLEGYDRGVVVVGILAGDGVEEVSSIFDSAGQNPKAHQSASTRLFQTKHPTISARQTATIFKVDPSSISKRLAGKIRSRAFVVQGQQTLT
jgi:hypothetical protein